MEPQKSLAKILILAAVLSSSSGCAMMFAQDKMPDLRRVAVGAERKTVESELGKPISEARSDIGQPGGKKCVYKLIVRAKPAAETTTANNVADKFVGYETYQYLVIYDRSGHVQQFKELPI